MAKAKKALPKDKEPVKEAAEAAQAPMTEEPRATPEGLRRVKVTEAELAELQNKGKLIGYDPATNEAIIK